MTTQSPELRLASLADADQIARMSSDLIEVGLGWSWTVQRVTRAIQCPDTTVLTAKAGLTVLGFAEAHLNLLAVAPNDRRRGVGRHLMQWLEESCRVVGSFVIYLEVRATNPVAMLLPASRIPRNRLGASVLSGSGNRHPYGP